jgi:EmrB/QacA subfamily drug resistance transporter
VARDRSRYGITLAVLCMAALSYSMLQSLLLPALPSLEKQLHISPGGASWLLTGFLLTAAVATPIIGRIGDQIGKEKMIVGVLAILTTGTFISALATALPLMLLGRVIQGVGGGLFPLAFGIIRDEFPKVRVAGAIGILSALLGLGGGIGIMLSGVIITRLDYHWLFWVPLVLALISTVAIALFVPESPVRVGGGINWLGAALMSAWLITLLVGVSEGPSWGWKSASVLGLFAITLVLIPLWIWSEKRSPNPLIDMEMMKVRAVWTTNLSSLLLGAGMFAMFLLLPQFTQTPPSNGYGFGATVTESGLYLLPNAMLMLLVAPLTGRLATRFGSKPLLVAGGCFAATAYILLAFFHAHPWNVYLCSGILGIGVGLGFSSMTNLIVEAVPADQTGVATGMNTNVRNVGAAMGAAVATSLVVSVTLADGLPGGEGYTRAFLACGGMLIVAVGAALAIPKRLRPSIVPTESHPGMLAEAEIAVGAIGYTPEPEA